MATVQIVEPMYELTGYQKTNLLYILNKLSDAIKMAIEKDGTLQLNGIGTFSLLKKKARVGRNPKDGSALQIPEKTVLHFKMHRSLRDAFKK